MIDLERQFLEEILNQQRDIPPSILNGLVDYLISCGVRWFRNWESTGTSLKPSLDEIVDRKNTTSMHDGPSFVSNRKTRDDS